MAKTSKEMKLSIKIAGKVEKSFGKSMKTVCSNIKTISKVALSATTVAATAVAAIGTKAIQAGIEYESAFAGVKKTVDATDEQLRKLDSSIRDMSSRMPTAATDIAAVAEAAGQLGIKTDNIASFTEVMVKLGDATNLTADDAATTLARFANVTQMDPKNYSNLGSTIVALGNNFATTESEITDMGQNLASAGTQIGLTQAQIMGMAAALSSVGLESAAGGTAMSKLMINMQLAVETGSKKLEDYAKVAGMTGNEFKKAFENDAAGAIGLFLNGLNDTKKNGKSAIAVLDEMGITETRLRDTILRAAGAGDTYTDAIKLSSQAWKENAALDNEVEQRYSTMESRINILKNAVTNLGISFYQSTRDDIGGAVDIASDSINTLQAAFNEGGLSGMLGALGGVLSNIINYIVEQLPSFMTAGAELLKSLITGICDNSDAIVDAIMQVLNILVDGVLTLAPMLLQLGGDILVQLVNGLAEQAPTLIPKIVDILIQMCAVFNENFDLFMQAGLKLIWGLIVGIVKSIPMIIQNIGTIISTIFNILTIQGFGELFKGGKTLIKGIIQGLKNGLPNLKVGASGIIDKFIEVLHSFEWKTLGKNIINGLKNGIIAAKAALLNVAKQIFQSIKNIFKGKISANVSVSKSGGDKKSKGSKHAKGGIFKTSTVIPAINAAHAAGGVFTKPTVIPSVNGANHLVGEAGAEAILPLDSVWQQFANVNSNIRSITLDPVFASANEKLTMLADALSKQNAKAEPKGDSDNNNPQIVYSPTIIIQGNADEKDIKNATKLSFEEFKKLYSRMKKEEKRVRF